MTWQMAGWVLIGVSAILVVVFSVFIKRDKGFYTIRKLPAIRGLKNARISAIERGKDQQVVIGHLLLSRRYPGLGLQALMAIPALLDPETVSSGKMVVSASDGSLVVFANQIIQAHYQDGFSLSLHNDQVSSVLHGLSPLSFTAGIMMDINANDFGSLAMFGNYGSESAIWAVSGLERTGYSFAAAGSITSQAVLYTCLHDLLIGEEVYMLPGALSNGGDNESALVEDILRTLFIVLLVAAVILKLAGIL